MEGMPVPDYVKEIGAVANDCEEVLFKGKGEMLDLPALVSVPENCARSFWLPSKEEIVALQEGHYVMLTVWGSQPPVALTVI